MENELRLMLSWFEKKVDEAERDYKEKHKKDFDKEKMSRYINRKFKREIEALMKINLLPITQILESAKRFKYLKNID